MAAVTLDSVTKRFGSSAAIDDVSLAVAEGEFLAVLGPSGCGKSTLLRLIAGFEKPDKGTIRLGANVVSGPGIDIAPEDRHIGMVFQSYALWPHMTVAENISYPMRVRNAQPSDVAREVGVALAAVGMEGMGERRPAELSGGQRQRVALARCLTMRARVVLLDEPLANLDAHLRARMLAEIASFRSLSHATLIYVTHDQAEAFAVADRVAVMEEGRVRQVAPPAVLYRTPSDSVVSRFAGGGAVVQGEITATFGNGHATAALFGKTWRVRAAPAQAVGPAEICIRPEDLRIVSDGSGFGATVARVLYQGGRTVIEATSPQGTTLSLSLSSTDVPAPGTAVHLAVIDGWVIPQH